MASAAAIVAIVCGSVGLELALHYVMAPWLTTILFGIGALVFFARPEAWLIAVPALLPVLALEPWTGWITFEELDLLVLAVGVGGYARLAFPLPNSAAAGPARPERVPGAGALACLFVTVFAVWELVAMARGFADAGGFVFGWYQGYDEPLNSLRLAKPFFLALLLWPLWSAVNRVAPEKACARLSLGLMIGLGGAALAATWERVAFTGLLNFSTDYRTTALFWEMQVGGAALDGFLALTVPFAVLVLLTARGRWRWAVAAGVAMLAAYACLTTFSRAVYLSVPIGVGVTVWLQGLQRTNRGGLLPGKPPGANRARLWKGFVLSSAFAAAAATMFPTSGYRGLLALLGAALVLLPLAGLLARCSVREWLLGLGCGAMLSGVEVMVAFWLPKGPYVVYALAVLSTFAVLAWHRLTRRAAAAPLALAGFVTVLTCVGLVAWHWGYEPALWRALPVLVALLAVTLAASRVTWFAWPADLRWQGTAFGTMVLAGISIGVFSGGAYMDDRISTTDADLGVRIDHWQQSLSLLKTPADLWLGKGLGRFPADFALAARDGERPGDYRWLADGDNGYLALSGGTNMMGWGELLRVSQRVDVPKGAATVRVDVRAADPVTLHVEVCEKHLLYNGSCVVGALPVKARPGQWQTLQVPLAGGALSRGSWYAPRLLAFSIAIESNNRRVEVDNLALADASGRNLLRNGDFSDGMAHWFFTSDRNHLPWHAKNMAVHVLIEQGLIGLTLLCALALGALWRVTVGHGRNHFLAPAIAGALIAFLIVGTIDSLLNVPRVAFLFYLLVLLGLSVRAANPPRDTNDAVDPIG